MPASAPLRGSAGPLPARRRFCFKRQSASSAAAAEPEEDEPEAAQLSCSKVTGSVRFLIPRPYRPAVLGAPTLPARLPACAALAAVAAAHSRQNREPGAHCPSHPQPQAAASTMDQRRRPVGHRGQSAQGSRQLRPQATPPSPPLRFCGQHAQHPQRQQQPSWRRAEEAQVADHCQGRADLKCLTAFTLWITVGLGSQAELL
ncbi:hypothetical protein NN561_009813 [Cricetulus griseus]